MKITRIALAALVLFSVLLLVGCSSNGSNLQGDGLHATVPSVQGMSVSNATERLHEAGYEVGSVAPAGAKGSDVVQTQEPVGGTALPRGGQVSLKCVR
ncbi:MAG TPA: PASTA domain-containing protein [Coriobacteriia bacterium]|nr:PASTA domain-containing protein [Coriobacteriia bacterium]